MSMIQMKDIAHSMNEQKKAIQEMFDLFPNARFDLNCSSFNDRCFTGFEVSVPFDKFVPIAHGYYINHDELFDFDRPKVIGTNWNIWNYFINVHLWWHGKYNHCYTDSYRPYKRSEISQSISLSSVDYNQGLKHWKSNYSKLKNLLNVNPSKKLVEAYIAEIEKINDEVLRWELALKEASKIDLNGKI